MLGDGCFFHWNLDNAYIVCIKYVCLYIIYIYMYVCIFTYFIYTEDHMRRCLRRA